METKECITNYDFMVKINLEKLKQYAVSRFKLQSSAYGMGHWKSHKKLLKTELLPQIEDFIESRL